MVFIDGTNFLISLFKKFSIDLRAEKPPLEVFSLCRTIIAGAIRFAPLSEECLHIRSYWLASYQGNDELGDRMYEALRQHLFEPVLLKKVKNKPEKGVDIELTKEMLVNAFNNNYDVAILFAGDEDYVNLVKEVKRYGTIIIGSFFETGLSPLLKRTFDYFHPIQTEPKFESNLQDIQKRQQKAKREKQG
jgi:uncharacterized LabA/DUF88 family protein